jgi:beta-glucanase (GH16 family)
MEMVGGSGADRGDNFVFGTTHWWDNGQHAEYGGSNKLPTGKYSDEFHVFTIIWSPNSIKWYRDDIKYHEINITGAGLSEFHENFHFIFNVAVGGEWPGSPNGNTQFPQIMAVDYVRVFQQ